MRDVTKVLTASLPATTKLGQGYIFTPVCDSVNRGGGYPSMPCRSVLGGWVSQHALQVSPGGVGIPAFLADQSQGGVWSRGGVWSWGVWSRGGVGKGGLRRVRGKGGTPHFFLGIFF